MFQQENTAKIEYRQTGLTKVVSLIFAGVIFFVGIASCYLFSTRFPLVQGKILSLLIIVGSIYFLATVLRSRILIEGTRIKVRNAFGERSADLVEIAGVRDIYGKYGASVTGKLLCLKAGRGTITIPMMVFDIDDRFRNWLQQLPDLEKRDQ
jgi:hypothetical protein